MSLSLLTSQLIAAVILFTSTLVCGTCPTWIGTTVAKKTAKKRARQEALLRDSGMSSVVKTTVNIEPCCSSSHDDRQRKPMDSIGTRNNASLSSRASSSSTPSIMESKMWKYTLSFLMNFGGGVLLATSILHMLPEVRENFTPEAAPVASSYTRLLDSISNSNGSDQIDRIRALLTLRSREATTDDGSIISSKTLCGLPMTELLVCAGFFLIYLAEELVHACLSHSRPEFFGPGKEEEGDTRNSTSQGKRKSERKRGDYHDMESDQEGGTVFVVCSEKQELISSESGKGKRVGRRSSDRSILKKKAISNCCKLPAYGSIVSLPEGTGKVTSQQQEESDHLLNPSLGCLPSSSCTTSGTAVVCCNDRDCNGDDDDDDCCEDDRHTFNATSASSQAESNLSVFRCIMIVFALSFHSIFDGLAIGLQDTTGHMVQLMVAVSMHKLLIAFVVGLEIFSATQSVSRVFLYMLPFSLMSPIGLIIAALTKLNLGESLVGILTGLSTGSLLYITFFEILFREKTTSKLSGLIQFLAVISGFCLMALLQTLTEH